MSKFMSLPKWFEVTLLGASVAVYAQAPKSTASATYVTPAAMTAALKSALARTLRSSTGRFA
jgi:hypothetical protein